ncbi:MAG: hypothetical protein NTW87_16070 [Planctomycetota bacterium]|nr:hypothetical protein [Planctomycetota bacterium]
MGTAYTPGLKVSPDAIVHKTRRLPVKGTVLVKVGDVVQPDTVVARAELPGDLETVRLAERMGMDADELQGSVKISVGQKVEKGQLLAEVKGFFGFFRTQVNAPSQGTVEYYAEVTGNLGIRKAPVPIEINAYVRGAVSEVLAGEGVIVAARGAFIQGIFGVGGERQGDILIACASPADVLTTDRIPQDCAGKVLVGGSLVGIDALNKAAERKAAAVVVGGILNQDLRAYLGYDLGVAITGDENVPLTLILTEGFGAIPMAERTFSLLRALQGRGASVNGATQIRAGAMRPEIIVPHAAVAQSSGLGPGSEGPPASGTAGLLAAGTPIRAIREPYFGQLGEVADLPPEPVRIGTGAVVRVLRMKLTDGRVVEVPRANVEIIER